MKLNLGAGHSWNPFGDWVKLDHMQLRPFSLPRQAWDLPFANSTIDAVFCSHVIEHISHVYIERVLCEVNRVLVPGGVFRILTPDFEKLCRAYVSRDMEKLRHYLDEDESGISMDLGPAQAVMGLIHSAGFDNIMLDSSRSRILAGYAHVACYDFELLAGLLDHYGFREIERPSVDDSRIEEHKLLRAVPHDRDREHSLVVECVKDKYVPFVPERNLLLPKNYSYSQITNHPAFRLTNMVLTVTSRIENLILWIKRRVVGLKSKTYSGQNLSLGGGLLKRSSEEKLQRPNAVAND